MRALSRAKELSISLGLYKPARLLQRAFSSSERKRSLTYRRIYSGLFVPGDLVFDVGANIGNMTEIMLELGANVVAFEPQSKCAREIAARNNGRLTVVQKAVGATEGMASLNLKSTTAIASLLPDWSGETTGILEVPVTTLDRAINEFGEPVFCKIDVEGFEAEVMRGLSTPLKALSLEYQSDERGTVSVRSCVEHLQRIGDYRINFTAHEDGEFILPDWIEASAFLETFPRCAGPIAYGDLFLKRV
jgi:FkbM family methyltransferase